METINQFAPTFLLNAVWQITLIACVAAVGSWLLRNTAASARYRHLLWVAALILSVVLPLTSLLNINSTLIESMPLLSRTTETLAATGNNPVNSTATSSSSGAMWLAAFFRNNQRSVLFGLPLASMLAISYMLFLLYRLLRLGSIWRRTNFIRKSARAQSLTPLMTETAARCRAALHLSEVEVLCSSKVKTPLTLGRRRPIIILPESFFEETSEELLASVLGHEMAHIRRGDFALNLFYELLYLPISFHPAAALVKRHINRTRELICDEMVAERIVESSVYARSLIRLADSAISLSRPDYTLGVFDADILEERIMRLIERKRFSGARAGKLLAFAIALVLGATSLAASAFSFQVGRYVKEALNNRETAIVGTWHANWPQHKELPALDLTVNSDAGKLSGTIIFHWLLYKEGGAPVTGQVETALIDPKFNGTTLSFRTKGKRPDNDQEKAFAMKLVSDNELQLVSDDSKQVFHLTKNEKSATSTIVSPQTTQTNSVPASAAQNLIVGDWNLRAYGGASNGEEAEGPGLVLKIKTDGDKLNGTAISWKEAEPKQNWQKVEWPLIEPKFDGNTFTFKVSNGEEILAGELLLVGDKFEGRWNSSKSNQNGRLKLTRRD